MAQPEIPLEGGSHSRVVRVGQTVRRVGRPWSSAVQDLLRHLDHEGFGGAPRALGFDDQGRELLTGLPTVQVKTALTRFSSRHLAPRKALAMIEQGARDALQRLGATGRAIDAVAAPEAYGCLIVPVVTTFVSARHRMCCRAHSWLEGLRGHARL